MELAFEEMGIVLPDFALGIRRKEIYTGTSGSFVCLDDIGLDIL